MVCALLCNVLLSPAWGQQAASREQEQIRRLRQQVQQLQQDQASQQQAVQRATAEKVELKAKLDAALAQLKRLQAGSSAQAKSATDAQSQAEALRAELAAQQTRADEQRAALETAAGEGRKLAGSNAQLQAQVAARQEAWADLQARHIAQGQGLQTCIANNQGLYALGQELLQRWSGKGFREVVVEREPFFQFKRVALENLVQGYQDKLDPLAIKPAPSVVPASEPGHAP
jgi:predicted RNase H-like nuclease (RuvC/YqgF family)